MKRLILACLLLHSASAYAQTVGQYEIRKRTGTGFTSYGVTLSNGQVIGQTAGVPAAITVSGGTWGSITGTLSDQTDLASALGLKLAAASNLSDLASASTARTNLGLGAAALLGTSSTGSSGSVAVYGILGSLSAVSSINVSAILGANTTTLNPSGFVFSDGTYSLSLYRPALTANRQIDMPDVSGVVLTTGNLSSITTVGTVTSGTWQGSVIAPAYLGTGSSITTKFLRGDGTWQTVAGTGDMTKAVYDSQNLGLITGLQGAGGGGNVGGVGGALDLSGGDSGITPVGAGGVGGTGGYIYTYGGNGFTTDPASSDFSGGNGGSINTTGSNAVDGVAGAAGGDINTSASGGQAGGSINTSAGGGSIDTSNSGGSIDTKGTGSIEFGVVTTRTTLVGSATAARTITMPDVTGTIITTGNISSITAATTTVRGTVELATDGETNASVAVQGNDTRLTNANKVEIGVAASDETSDNTASTTVPKLTFRMPHAMTLTGVRCSLTKAATNAILIVDIHEAGTTIMTTNKLTVDASETTSTTAATAATLTDTTLADDALIEIFLDQVGTTTDNTGEGVKVWLIGTR